ncbi:cob(I)yrinic acid a,c-diamide adenosyltransferase [Thermosyntropha sp.]|uniref:cob(I)yrinic acid a,c-diamide adenosyltransferase n=1 Tax=Thermosyntropha sp. TaxID=2740820 RepID=UPI0025D4DDFA|nr:cob(I)yrinic acid a,c-diamide adenosyltransferase [Thermosyntropha sp.]MBO8159529.1 cob(I)yrinic acid a,c-diamide adenosyltransferase [Thermosyntropha sp.]
MKLIFTGDGKGKTCSAVGLALRAWGQGKKVLFISFLKDALRSGEFKAINLLSSSDLVFFSFGRRCPYEENEDCCPGKCECIVLPSNIEEDDYDIINKGLEIAEKEILSELWDVVVLDEIVNVYNLFPRFKIDIMRLLKNIPDKTDIVFTGRNCPPELLDLVDLVSEIKNVKHPFNEGIKAKRGIDY